MLGQINSRDLSELTLDMPACLTEINEEHSSSPGSPDWVAIDSLLTAERFDNLRVINVLSSDSMVSRWLDCLRVWLPNACKKGILNVVTEVFE